MVLLLCVIFVFVGVLYIGVSEREYMYATVEAAPTSQTALVPGASIISTSTLSQVLKERADRAIELYRAGKVKKILVTGDNASLYHNEVDPVGKYMYARGVPQEDIFLDHAGFDTYSSMYRARDVFGVTSLTVVSQAFHLPRALFIAHTLGLTAYGVDAGNGELFLYNYIREIPASVKAISDLYLERLPKYLGPRFPIEGSALGTWSLATSSAQSSTTPQ